MTGLLAYKVLVPIVLVLFSVVFSLYLSSFLRWSLDLTKAFDITTASEPAIELKLKGYDGGFAMVGMNFPDEGAKPYETAVMSKNSSEELRKQLDALELEKWEFLSKIPSTLVKFNAYIYSDPESPNNGKLVGTFKVKTPSSEIHILKPGQSTLIGNNFKFGELVDVMKGTELYLESEMMTSIFHDPSGDIIPQTTGSIYIKPTLVTQLYILMASLAAVVAVFSILKSLLFSGKDLKEVVDYYMS